MKRVKVYIASPYTKGDVALNVHRSLEAADLLIKNDFVPFAPLLSHFQHLVFPHPYETWLSLDMEWLPVCDAVITLPGESAGRDAEVAYANRLGIPVFDRISDLMTWRYETGRE